MQKPETKTEKDFCDWVHGYPTPAVALKLVLFSGGGFPDRTICIEPGIIFFIEFKEDKNDQQRRQSYWEKILTKLGFNYYVCYSKEEAIETFFKEVEASQLSKKMHSKRNHSKTSRLLPRSRSRKNNNSSSDI